MMLRDTNYRFCVKASLQILRKGREKLCNDSIQHNPTIYSGLHEFQSETKKSLYFQAYLVEWIDNHWNDMTDLIQARKRDFNIDERKSMALFFSEYFSQLIKECENKGTLSKLAIHDLLKAKRRSLLKMAEMADAWQENYDKLEAEKKKHKEQFARMLAEADTKGE